MSIPVNIATAYYYRLFQKLSCGKFPYLDKLQDNYRIFTMIREPIRLPDIRYPVFGI